MSLQDFCDVHWIICKYINIINRLFGLRLISIIIYIFYKLTFIPYQIVLNLIETHFRNLFKELTNASLLCFYLALLFLLALSSDDTNTEVCM